jgi:hypothetical protein
LLKKSTNSWVSTSAHLRTAIVLCVDEKATSGRWSVRSDQAPDGCQGHLEGVTHDLPTP